ncbi:hypothetical protein ACFUIY_10425 [Streptomyces griseorubiginosus]|uniref:hypothetical protein n=1 Tax=Streptomyces griseorubiginosus TaxID=67304 RepID=UPI00114004FE|nr:hypothetical protein [Streptomyces griseorubiginosus]
MTIPVTGLFGDRWLGRNRLVVAGAPSVTRVGFWAEEAVMSEGTVPLTAGAGQPKGLLQQMEELMAALNADLSALDADLQGAGGSGRAVGEEEAG